MMQEWENTRSNEVKVFVTFIYRDKHDSNAHKGGKVTNPAISSILGTKPEPNLELEKEYRRYCEYLGIEVKEAGTYGVQRKFWKL